MTALSALVDGMPMQNGDTASPPLITVICGICTEDRLVQRTRFDDGNEIMTMLHRLPN